VRDDVDERSCVVRRDVQLVAQLCIVATMLLLLVLMLMMMMLWRHQQMAGRMVEGGVAQYERHLERGAERADRADRRRRLRREERKHASRHHLAYCETQTKRTINNYNDNNGFVTSQLQRHCINNTLNWLSLLNWYAHNTQNVTPYPVVIEWNGMHWNQVLRSRRTGNKSSAPLCPCILFTAIAGGVPVRVMRVDFLMQCQILDRINLLIQTTLNLHACIANVFTTIGYSRAS